MKRLENVCPPAGAGQARAVRESDAENEREALWITDKGSSQPDELAGVDETVKRVKVKDVCKNAQSVQYTSMAQRTDVGFTASKCQGLEHR